MASKAKGTKKVAAKKPAAKKGAVRKVDRTRKVSPEEVHQVMELVKAGKSSIMAEADRLGVYHATLRATCRSIVGEAKYDSIMKGPAKKARLAARAAAVESKKAKVSTKKKAAKKAPKAKKAATPPTTEASTEGEQTA